MQMPTMQDFMRQIEAQRESIRAVLTRYQKPSISRSIWQMVNTLIPFFGLWALAVYTFNNFPYWVTLLISMLGAGFIVRRGPANAKKPAQSIPTSPWLP